MKSGDPVAEERCKSPWGVLQGNLGRISAGCPSRASLHFLNSFRNRREGRFFVLFLRGEFGFFFVPSER